MSTFTTIRTSIRDTATMFKVLQNIPGAHIKQNVVLPLKAGGYGRVDFQVTLGNNRSSVSGLFGKLLGSVDLRYFLVYRGDDGQLYIEINQEQVGHRSIESVIDTALRPVEQAIQQKEAEREQSRMQRIEELRRLQQEQQAKAEEERRLREAQLAEEARRNRRLENERRARQLRDAEAEAEQIVRAMEKERAQSAVPRSPQTAGPQDDNASDRQQEMEQGLSAALAQEYAKEKVLEQLDDIQAQYGVALGGIETLQDGTIEITLRG
jgi:hypothetical protein